jgi:hypothetical protein
MQLFSGFQLRTGYTVSNLIMIVNVELEEEVEGSESPFLLSEIVYDETRSLT